MYFKVKTFTAEELALFRKPFEIGWKREVVLRGTLTSSGKKRRGVVKNFYQRRVNYFPPDRKTKLRSYVEMGLYCESFPPFVLFRIYNKLLFKQ